MNDIETFKQELDRVDTGQTGPEPAALRSAVHHGRLRRAAIGVTAAAGALVLAAVAAPAVLPGPDDRTAAGTSSRPATTTPVGPEFGERMRDATLARFADARPTAEAMADHEVWVRTGRVVEPALHDPVVWDSLYWWNQTYRLPGGVSLTVTAERQAPGTPPGTMFAGCEGFGYPSQKSCEDTEVGDLQVAAVDGTRYDDPDFWHREVNVIGGSMERGMPMYTSVHTSVDGVETWAQARALLPDAAQMRALALDSATHLPEPRFFDSGATK